MLQVLANGLISGLVVALLGLGFTVASLPTRVFHVALAGIYTITPFLAWTLWRTDWSPALCVTTSLLAATAISAACEAANHWPLERKEASDGLHLISSLGISIILVQAAAMIWGNEHKILREGVGGAVEICGLRFAHSQIIAGAVSGFLLAGFALWLHRSRLGLQFRALADNPVQLILFGYNIRVLRLLAFALSGLLVGTASLLTAYDVGFDPHGGLQALLLGVVAVIVGGRGTWFGPVLAGVVLGTIRAFVVWQLSARWQDAATYVVLVLVLFLRPDGLLGRRTRLEATF